uniref:Transcriptional regulator, AcrR family n=1 Tax=Klebsiella pneumoniae TaxID=573 RepID=A0A8B0SZX1_KLEPN|nr:Transcriptional regulator, AcrR family [Klebsiella pneumoniae]
MSTYDKNTSPDGYLNSATRISGFQLCRPGKKEIGIRKASIHHHFPGKTDLGLAYCEYKTGVFSQLDAALHDIPPGVQRLRAYLDAFAGCAEREEMCGVYAMLSDSHQFSSELQKAVSCPAQTEMLILKKTSLLPGRKSGELRSVVPPDELAIIVCSALKGALMLNRIPPHDAYTGAVDALMMMLDART